MNDPANCRNVYKPLYIDTAVESLSYGATSMISRVWNTVFGRSALPYGRRSVDAQLRGRSAFPVDDWLETCLPLRDVACILNIVKERLEHVNYFFAPFDPLQLVFIEAYNEYAVVDVGHGIEHTMGIALGQQWWSAIYCDVEAWTVERFVRFVLEKRQNES